MSLCVIFLCVLKIEELGAQGMVDEAQSLMTQVEELEKEKNSYSARSGSRVCTYNDLQAPMLYAYLYHRSEYSEIFP